MQVGFVSQTNCRSFPACIVFLFQMSQRQRSFNANLRVFKSKYIYSGANANCPNSEAFACHTTSR
ncbi:AVN_HP_G0113480.mRNA.1.CDS.1 [Saccharomyces cerevisiae]|nr:AVN_HP_G0113480.mRNA.1.CDS.1 [Saccharomyces cerevisiae]CAI6991294.1 AVN_HP_G0113480.mRNA.1.CDS.1 [Saccharomyces cerevisiae]